MKKTLLLGIGLFLLAPAWANAVESQKTTGLVLAEVVLKKPFDKSAANRGTDEVFKAMQEHPCVKTRSPIHPFKFTVSISQYMGWVTIQITTNPHNCF